MRPRITIALATGALALAAVPATASAVDYQPAPGPEYKPAPPPPPPAHAKAHGKRCQGKSKKHVKGQKGTEFSRCVRALNKAKNNPHMTPGQVCKNESREHVKGVKGTAFSRCVKLVAHQRREERRKEREEGKISSAATVSVQPEDVPKGKGPEYAPAPEGGAAPPPQAKAHGKRCQGKSRKHVKGEQGTEFSRCVRALNKAEDHPGLTPRQACKGLSKEHVKGEQGTEFSRCVKEVAQLRREERRKEREEAAV